MPVSVNVIQHPVPTPLRCYKLGQALRRAVESYDEDIDVVIVGTGGMSHQLHGERAGYLSRAFDMQFLDLLESDPERLTELSRGAYIDGAGAEAVELIMWLTCVPTFRRSQGRSPRLALRINARLHPRRRRAHSCEQAAATTAPQPGK
jgi:hypothetical protein